MRNYLLIFLLFYSIDCLSQPFRTGYEYVGSKYRSNTDTAAWLSDLRQYEPKIPLSLNTRYYRGDKTWQDFNSTVLGINLSGLSLNNTPITSSDNFLTAFGKAQAQINSRELYLGAPSVNGSLLASNTAGGRSWFVLPDYMLKYSGQAHQNNMLSSGIYSGLDNPGGGADDFTTFTAWNGGINGGFQLQSYDDAGFTGAYSANQMFYMRSYDYRSSYKIWRPWKRLLTDDDLTAINLSISNSPGTFQGSISNFLSPFIVSDYTLRRQGNVVNLTMRLKTTTPQGSNTYVQLCQLPSGYYPTSQVYGAMATEQNNLIESAVVKITSTGEVWCSIGKENAQWLFNITWIILTP